MKICVAQTSSIKGAISANIKQHLYLIKKSVSKKVDLIIFPELSLTGYEPSLAKELAITKVDSRFQAFQDFSDQYQITIGVGMPTKCENDIHISLILFQPKQNYLVYSKKNLHFDELPFFKAGKNFSVLKVKDKKIGLAICYELSIKAHSELAIKNGAEVYIASVAKSANGMIKANEILAKIAKRYKIPVLIANCLGSSDDFLANGNSAIWNHNGDKIGQLNGMEEGLLIYDLANNEVIIESIKF